MKKQSKILAVILSVCILCSMVAVFTVSASTAQLIPSKSSATVAMSFENDGANYNSSTKNATVDGFKLSWSVKNSYNNDYFKSSKKNDANGNGYLNFSHLAAKTDASGESYWDANTGSYSGGVATQYPASQIDYYVFSYDICADQYLYTEDGITKITTDGKRPSGEGITDVRLAYPSSSSFYQYIRQYSGSSWGSWKYAGIKIKPSGNDWYAYVGATSAPGDTYPSVKLPTEAGVWSNFTIIVKVDTANSKHTISQYVYFNGENVYAAPNVYSVTNEICFTSYRFQFDKASITSAQPYSIGVDNISASYYLSTGEKYDVPYSSGNDVYGLDDYFGGKVDTTIDIYNCEDIAYNKNYVSPQAVASVDGILCYSLAEVEKSLKENSVVTLYRSFENFTPTVESVTVKMAENITFSLSAVANENYAHSVSIENGIKTYTVFRATTVPVIWQDETGKVIHESTVYVGEAPDSDLALDGKVIDLSIGKYAKFAGWETDQIAGDVLSEAEYMSLVLSGGSVYMKPVYEEETATAYIISNGNVILLAENDISNIQTNVSSAKSGATVTLYDDVYINLSTYARRGFLIAEDSTLNFDLNGNRIVHQGNGYYYDTGTFVLNEKSVLNIYNSNKDKTAEMYQALYYSKKVGAQVMFEINAADSCELNINGDNIDFYCGTIVDVVSNRLATSRGGEYKININGGRYFSIFSPSYGAFAIRNSDVALNITNALIYAAGEGSSIFHVDYRNYSVDYSGVSGKISVKDSVVIQDTKASSMFHGWNDSCTLIFENCVVSGIEKQGYMIGSVYAPHITFKGTNYIFESDLSASLFGVETGTNLVYNNNDSLVLPQSVIERASFSYRNLTTKNSDTSLEIVIPDEEDVNYSISLPLDYSTFAGQISDSNIKKVVWKNAVGGEYKAEYWYVGSTVAHPSAYDMIEDKASFPVERLGNGWYDKGYSSWQTENEAASLNTVVADVDNVFLPVKSIVANVKASFNVSTYGNFQMNVYIPGIRYTDNTKTSVEGLPENVTLNGFYTNAALTSAPNSSNHNDPAGNKYIRFYGYANSNNVTVSYSLYVSFTVTEGDEKYDLVYRITFDLAKYANAVLAQASTECGSEEAKLAVAMMQYASELVSYNGEKYTGNGFVNYYQVYEAAKKIVDAHSSCGCTTSLDYDDMYDNFSEEEKAITAEDYEHLTNFGVYASAFILNINQSTVALYINKDNVYIPVDGTAPTDADLLKVATIRATYTGVSSGTIKQITGNFTKQSALKHFTVDGVESVPHYEYRLTAFGAYNMSAVLKIELLNVNGDVLSTTDCDAVAQYSLSTYITNNQDVKVARALYAFAKAAYDYKVDEPNEN